MSRWRRFRLCDHGDYVIIVVLHQQRAGLIERLRIFASGGIVTSATYADPGVNKIAARNVTLYQGSDTVGEGSIVHAAKTATGFMFVSANQLTLVVALQHLLHQRRTNFGTMRPSGCTFLGTNTSDNAVAGYIGEYQEVTASPGGSSMGANAIKISSPSPFRLVIGKSGALRI